MRENLNVQLCPVCETGRKDYLLDSGSAFCTHISCLKDGKCNRFEPLKSTKITSKALNNIDSRSKKHIMQIK